MITFSRFHHVFQLLKKNPPPISMNHDMSNNILSIDPLSDVASDIQLLKPTTKYTLEQTTQLLFLTIHQHRFAAASFPFSRTVR